MFAPRVFVNMIAVLIVFAVVTYFLTGSLSTTIIQTLICAVLVQVGYFVGVLLLVWKASKNKKAGLPLNERAPPAPSSAGEPGDKADSVSVSPLGDSGRANHPS